MFCSVCDIHLRVPLCPCHPTAVVVDIGGYISSYTGSVVSSRLLMCGLMTLYATSLCRSVAVSYAGLAFTFRSVAMVVESSVMLCISVVVGVLM